MDAAAYSDANVLITGESGAITGSVAQVVHFQSRRGRGPLVTVNCAAGVRPENFQRLEIARGGTILIEHIQEMSREMQAHLLLFLESGRRLLDVRVIAAADGDLLAKVRAGEFREDLYYRLNIIHLVLPAVLERHDRNAIGTPTAI